MVYLWQLGSGQAVGLGVEDVVVVRQGADRHQPVDKVFGQLDKHPKRLHTGHPAPLDVYPGGCCQRGKG